ncbi:dicarbonyl/L-xylulose reductase [Reticulomyxa filosa]|uniref:Dicarbonyl/L-xylulose reductase n=1 Tax=Reticulomyxa filosa TaxID=46433 RepID=X6MAG4_RETFI|nr:dicarbonyl/L-xylulose reductase [Reticulomyxa filosa]|eukprot:ETO10020.1 dicarbonyl/L-xylulose reductase [Reticulomyxa filosa]
MTRNIRNYHHDRNNFVESYDDDYYSYQHETDEGRNNYYSEERDDSRRDKKLTTERGLLEVKMCAKSLSNDQVKLPKLNNFCFSVLPLVFFFLLKKNFFVIKGCVWDHYILMHKKKNDYREQKEEVRTLPEIGDGSKSKEKQEEPKKKKGKYNEVANENVAATTTTMENNAQAKKKENEQHKKKKKNSLKQQRRKVWLPRFAKKTKFRIARKRFEDRIVCVTGVGKGIGHDLILELLQEKAFVIGVSRTQEDLDKLRQIIDQRVQLQQAHAQSDQKDSQDKKEGDEDENEEDEQETEKKNEKGNENAEIKTTLNTNPSYRLICADLSVRKDVETVVQECIAAKVDMLVNNAGVAGVSKFLDTKYEDLRRVHSVNFEAAFLLSQGIAKYWVENKIKGSIVNISSSASLRVLDEHTAYCTSKFALDGLTKCMALELGCHGIRVNSVHPTVVLTPMGISVWQNNSKKGNALLELIPMHRFVETQEVIKAVMFLLSDESSMITGALLPIDGGLSL